MSKMVIELESSQLLKALEQLPPKELKRIIDTLFLKNLLEKPNFEKVSSKARKIVKKEGVKEEVVGEAIRWARRQK
jgi:hypothetical protein